jgi:hypothetical protein
VGVNKIEKQERYAWDSSESMIRTIREAIGNYDHPARCGNFSIEKSSSRMESAHSVKKNLRTMVMLFRTTKDAKEWEELGETTIQITFKQCIGGAMTKRDQREWND